MGEKKRIVFTTMGKFEMKKPLLIRAEQLPYQKKGRSSKSTGTTGR
jgi:hypothetical protein